MNKKKIYSDYLKNINLLKKYNKSYYEKSNPKVTDEVYDKSGAVQIGANLSKSQIDEVMNFIEFKNLKEIKSNLKNSLSKEGILEMEKLLEIVSLGKYEKQVQLTLEKCRGLFYYDGWTVETELNFENWEGISK